MSYYMKEDYFLVNNKSKKLTLKNRLNYFFINSNINLKIEFFISSIFSKFSSTTFHNIYSTESFEKILRKISYFYINNSILMIMLNFKLLFTQKKKVFIGNFPLLFNNSFKFQTIFTQNQGY